MKKLFSVLALVVVLISSAVIWLAPAAASDKIQFAVPRITITDDIVVKPAEMVMYGEKVASQQFRVYNSPHLANPLRYVRVRVENVSYYDPDDIPRYWVSVRSDNKELNPGFENGYDGGFIAIRSGNDYMIIIWMSWEKRLPFRPVRVAIEESPWLEFITYNHPGSTVELNWRTVGVVDPAAPFLKGTIHSLTEKREYRSIDFPASSNGWNINLTELPKGEYYLILSHVTSSQIYLFPIFVAP